MSFSNVFGGGTLQATDVAYAAIALTANTTLVWPNLATAATGFAARSMDVTPSAGGFTLTLPPANAVSTGCGLLIGNLGAYSFTVANNAGTALVTIPAEAYYYLQVTTNTTVAGTWDVIGFGASSCVASAAALAGPGLSTSGSGTLQLASAVVLEPTGYSVLSTDRGSTQVWTGGTGTFTLPLSTAAGIGADYSLQVRNNGTGVLTIACSGGETIDGATTATFNVNDAAIIHSGGAGAWYTVGRGRNAQFNYTLLVQAVTGGTFTESLIQASNLIQKFTGTLTSSQTVVFPVYPQVYFVTNQTTGSYTLTFKSGTGTTVNVAQGASAVVFTDGTNCYSA